MLLKVATLTLLGGALPLFFAGSLPRQYDAETRLKVVAATETAVKDAALALRSKPSLDNLVNALNLGNASEFAVDRPSAVRVVTDIVSGDPMTMTQAENRLRDKLLQAIATTYDARTGEFVISVTADEAGDAARIANALAGTFRDEMAASGAKGADPLLEKLRQTLDRADAALSGFISGTDQQKLAEMRRSEGEGEQLSTDIADGERQLADIRQKVAQASTMKLEDVLTRPLPDSLEYTGLEYQRQRHVEAKLAVDQLTGNLGPRHPRLVAAQGALADVRNDIQTSLKQLVVSLRQQETAAVKRLADLKAKKTKTPDDKEITDASAKFSALESAAEEARRNYLEALQRSQQRTQAPVARVDVAIPATVAGATLIGLSPMDASAIGSLFGFCLGALLAVFTRRKTDPEELPVAAVAEARDIDLLDEDWQRMPPVSERTPVREEGLKQEVFADEDEWAHEPMERFEENDRYSLPAHGQLPARNERSNRGPAGDAQGRPIVSRPAQSRYAGSRYGEPEPFRVRPAPARYAEDREIAAYRATVPEAPLLPVSAPRAPAQDAPVPRMPVLALQDVLYAHYPTTANDPSEHDWTELEQSAGDTPFGDQIRDMLMANRRPVAEASLPPLVEAVLGARVAQQPAYSTRAALEEARKAEEARELRRHMAELRERVETYSASRGGGRS